MMGWMFERPVLVRIRDDDTGRTVGLRLWRVDVRGRHRYVTEVRWRRGDVYDEHLLFARWRCPRCGDRSPVTRSSRSATCFHPHLELAGRGAPMHLERSWLP